MNLKTSLLAAPAVMAGLIFGFVLVMGTLAARSSSIATQGSIELLRIHVVVAHLHDHLLEHSYAALLEHIAELRNDPRFVGPPVVGGADGRYVGPPDTSGVLSSGSGPDRNGDGRGLTVSERFADGMAASGAGDLVDAPGGELRQHLAPLKQASADDGNPRTADFVIVAARR